MQKTSFTKGYKEKEAVEIHDPYVLKGHDTYKITLLFIIIISVLLLLIVFHAINIMTTVSSIIRVAPNIVGLGKPYIIIKSRSV